MTTLNHRFSRQKIHRSGDRLTLRRSLTRPASITAATSHLLASSRTGFITRATCGIVCVRHRASQFSGFATSLSGIQRSLSWPTTIRETGFPAHRSGLIHHIPSLASSRSASWSASIHCQRTSTFSILQFRGLSCILTRMTAGDGFVVQLVFRHERSTIRCSQRRVALSVPHSRATRLIRRC